MKRARNQIPEEGVYEGGGAEDTVRVMVHQETGLALPSPYIEEVVGDYPTYIQNGSTGSQSPPLDCTGVSLITSEPRHTM